MGIALNNREYVRKIIFDILENNQISELESEKIKQIFLNFDQQDWENFKIVGKETVKEYFDREIEKFEISDQWKNHIKQLFRALINCAGNLLLDKEFINEAIQCEKSKILLEQRANLLLPLLTKKMRSMVAQKPTSVTVDYKTENSFRKKYNQAETVFMSSFIGNSAGNQMSEFKKILDLIKSLTPGEIKVLKEKLKRFGLKILDKYAEYEFTQCPPLKDFIQTLVDLIDVVSDETLVSEGIKIIVDMIEVASGQINLNSVPEGFSQTFKWGIKHGSKPEILKKMVPEIERRVGSRLIKLMQNLTQHLNLLAEENSQISATAEQEIARKLQEAKTERENNDSQEENGLIFISPTGLLPKILNHDQGIDMFEIFKEWRKELSNITLTTPKWYERTWLVVLIIAGTLAIGGFISWLIFRRKEKPFEERES